MSAIVYQLSHLRAVTNDIALITLFTQDKMPFTYQAGQYVEAQLENQGILLSIANAPREDGILQFHLRHNDSHPLAKAFLQKLVTDKKIILKGPFGNCTLEKIPKESNNPILFLAGGTGLAPLCALIEEAIHIPQKRKLHLFWGISHIQDDYAKEALIDFQKQFSDFSFDIVLSNPAFYSNWSGKTGLVHEQLAKDYPALNDYCVFASGPYPMIDRALSLFMMQGLMKNRFFSDLTGS